MAEAARLAVIGLGYVGTVTAACFARNGVRVAGVDVDESKVEAVNAGHTTFFEPRLEELLSEAVQTGRLGATADLAWALSETNVWLVAVGTPSGVDGDADLRAVHRVVSTMRSAIRASGAPPLIVLSSTVPPGTSESVVLPILEQDGLEEGEDFHFVYSPEFLREGSAVADFLEPERTVLGTRSNASRAAAEAFFSIVDNHLEHVAINTAEFAKYTDNTWHALKVGFANEIARVGSSMGVDPRAAMDLFARDKRLNISTAYLSPGFAFGGSCLPKDVRTLAVKARAAGVDVPLIASILDSNDAHVHMAVRRINELEFDTIVVVGLAFKSGTDDLRESPTLPLVRRLLVPDREVRVFDPEIDPKRLHGANALQLQRDLPEHRQILSDDLQVVDAAQVVVVTQRGTLARDVAGRLRGDQTLVDLAGALHKEQTEARYVGLAWQ